MNPKGDSFLLRCLPLFLICLFFALKKYASAYEGIVPPQTKPLPEEISGIYKESHALVVGISEYTRGWLPLPGVKKDIEAVKSTLEGQGFQVRVIENPDRKKLEAAIKIFVLEFGMVPENRLLFYFAGHGHTHKPENVLPRPENWLGYFVGPAAPRPEDSLTRFFEESLSLQNISEIAQGIESKHALFVFDSCFSSPEFTFNKPAFTDIRTLAAKPVRQFISSCSPDQRLPATSIFRPLFVSALEGKADRNQDGYVTGTELSAFLDENVRQLSQETLKPMFGAFHLPEWRQGDFLFPLGAKETEDPPLPAPIASKRNSNPTHWLLREMEDVLAKGERRIRVESYFTLLKELDGFHEIHVSRPVKIKLWKNFIASFPDNNHRLEEAQTTLQRLKNPSAMPSGRDAVGIDADIARLMEIDQSPVPIEQKSAAWIEFLEKYPDESPQKRFAEFKIQQLSQEQKLIEELGILKTGRKLYGNQQIILREDSETASLQSPISGGKNTSASGPRSGMKRHPAPATGTPSTEEKNLTPEEQAELKEIERIRKARRKVREQWLKEDAKRVGLTRSEGLRSTGAGEKNYITGQIFFGTDRKPTGISQPSKYFGENQGALKLGVAQVQIFDSGETGFSGGKPGWVSSKPEDFSNDRSIPFTDLELQSLTQLNEINFFHALKNSLQSSNQKDLFVYIHGFNNSFGDAVRQTARLAYDLGFSGMPVTYSWPSISGQSPTGPDYQSDEAAVHATKKHLVGFLEGVIQQAAPDKIHLLTHNLGSRATIAALKELAVKYDALIFDQVILVAPDIDANALKQEIEPALQLVKNITLYVSSNDKALRFSKIFHGGSSQAGHSGKHMKIFPGIDTVDASSIDVSTLESGHSHISKKLLEDILLLFRNGSEPEQRNLNARKRENLTYWEIPH